MTPLLKVILLCFLICEYTSQSFSTNSVKESTKREKRAANDLIFVIEPNDEMKENFVNKHNDLRRYNVTPSASNMRTMSWDDELEDLIKSHVKKCEFVHSSEQGRNTSTFPYVGENIYRGNVFLTDIPNESVQAWFNEDQYYTYSDASCESGQVCGHYTQVVWAESYKVGCAIAYCNNLLGGGSTGYLVGCDYGPTGNTHYLGSNGAVVNVQPYEAGASCSNCSGEFSGCLNLLCVNPSESATDAPATDPTSTQGVATGSTSADAPTTNALGTDETTIEVTENTSSTEDACNLSNCGNNAEALNCSGTSSSYTCVCNTNYISVASTSGMPRCIYNEAPILDAHWCISVLSLVTLVQFF